MDWRNSSSTKLEAGNMQIVPTIEDRVFDASVLVEFTCAICLHLIEDPRQCRYGHNICYKCFLELTKHPHLRSECPTCRAPMDKLEPNRNLVLETLLAKLDIYCRVRSFPRQSIQNSLGYVFHTQKYLFPSLGRDLASHNSHNHQPFSALFSVLLTPILSVQSIILCPSQLRTLMWTQKDAMNT